MSVINMPSAVTFVEVNTEPKLLWWCNCLHTLTCCFMADLMWLMTINSFWEVLVVPSSSGDDFNVLFISDNIKTLYLPLSWAVSAFHSLSLAVLLPFKTLTHPPLDKMATISQMVFSDAFLWMKWFVFWLKFHWSLFLRVQLTITQHWFR